MWTVVKYYCYLSDKVKFLGYLIGRKQKLEI